eukprot:SAG22_NODE_161_length_16908_cov_39.687965_11_plen_76_part_00
MSAFPCGPAAKGAAFLCCSLFAFRCGSSALDEYFSRQDIEKFEGTAQKDKKGALSKLEKIRLDQQKRLEGLEAAQ